MPLKKVEFKSQFDPKSIITDDSVALTLIRSGQKEFGIMPPRHAMIAIESVEDNKYAVHLTDLVNPYTKYENIGAVVHSHWGHSYDAHVRWLNVHKPVEYFRKSHTWVVSKDKVDLMLSEIQDEVKGIKEPPSFYMLGGKSLITYLTNYERHGKPIRNCIHWALDKLRLSGINLEQGSFNLATDSTSYTVEDNKYHLNAYGMKELCDFIKLGRIDAIRRFFPPQNPNINLNQLISGEVGSVEFQLRNYTPLMLACGYGQWDVAKMLINEYGVDVNVKTKKGFSFNFFTQWLFLSYNALDCAERNIFGLTKIAKSDDTAKQEVINLIKENMVTKEPLKNINVELPRFSR